MIGNVSKAIRQMKVFVCAVSTGNNEREGSRRKVAAWNKDEAEIDYRKQCNVHPLEPVLVIEWVDPKEEKPPKSPIKECIPF